jgi:hypothetical protein
MLVRVTRSAPRLDSRLIAAIARADQRGRPIAEIARSVGALAEDIGLARPSYESIRRVVHALRARKRDPGIGEVLLDINLRRRPPEAILDALVGTAPRLPK